MSLILDALRKSEGERRRGQAPDLFASVPVSVPARRLDLLRFWPWPVLAILVLGAGYALWPEHEQIAPALAEPVPSQAEADTENFPMLRTPGEPAPITAPAPLETKTARPSSVAVQPDPVQPAVLSPAPSLAQTTATEPVLAAAPIAAADGELLPPIAVLAASERAGLPPLRLSMHVWANEPGKRFAIIDGQRVTEGSTVGSSSIEEIRRDGVVLNINGRRILLPRP